MLIKKDEEPFFYKFLSIAKEIIRKNKRYTPVFYGDDEKLYLVCNNYAAVYDFQSNLLLDDELREFGKIPYELSELPNGDMKLTKSEHFSCQESYLIAIRNFFKHTGYMSKKVFSVDKGDPYKIPKIVEVTQRWISEEDNKILDKIGFPDIYMLDAKRVDEFITLAGDWNPYYLAACDQTELNGGQTTITMTVYFNIKEDPKKSACDQQTMELLQQPTNYDEFEDMNVEELEDEVASEGVVEATAEQEKMIEDDYQEEEQLDALLEDAIVPEELEDDFDPMLA
uniref:Uncharacterized protein n=1 Tax=Siphoviridae sp. ct4Z13 TaxID=2827778 RepID=A0A8S5SB62_9CAUD|nr:MAG TPA: hypothetical protein [Siphoviridae sp. ct4Z13]